MCRKPLQIRKLFLSENWYLEFYLEFYLATKCNEISKSFRLDKQNKQIANSNAFRKLKIATKLQLSVHQGRIFKISIILLKFFYVVIFCLQR